MKRIILWWIQFVVWLARNQFPILEDINRFRADGLLSLIDTLTQEAERTGSLGEHKNVYVHTATCAECYRQGKQIPRKRDINLCIEWVIRQY
ncbi:hypothetical protein COW64_17290 [bacterium (Candidatus Blackallbacteria) CG18_big_fil_WC_8_21_14_2_50_49_26]|nr:MAG: hypothetical protein COW64_17290 [bacterium (Candidatus Blackallbacteria) CG18_big_fil_WC_8_21_14_2_50_49_26]